MIRNLLGGFFITWCAGLVAAPSASFADTPSQQAYLDQQVLHLQQQLALTGPETARVKAAMQATLQGTATTTVAQVLHEICKPAPFAAWWATVLASERTSAASVATAQAEQIEKTVLLSAKQRDQMRAAFYQIEMADRASRLSIFTEAELESHLTHLAADRENALEKILTPAQIEKRTRIAQAGFNQPLPDLPMLSLAATLPSDRYGLDSDNATP